MATPSTKVAQTLASTTSKLGLNREARAALLRVRTRPECPEGNLRELTWDSNPNCGIAREREEKKERGRERERENHPMKSPNLRHCWPTHRTKDWANTRGEQAGCGEAHSLVEAGRQTWGCQSRKGAPSTKLRAGSQLLTKTSWYSGWLTSTGRVTARDQLPRRDTLDTWGRTSMAHPGNQAAGTGEAIRCTPHLGRVHLPSTW